MLLPPLATSLLVEKCVKNRANADGDECRKLKFMLVNQKIYKNADTLVFPRILSFFLFPQFFLTFFVCHANEKISPRSPPLFRPCWLDSHSLHACNNEWVWTFLSSARLYQCGKNHQLSLSQLHDFLQFLTFTVSDEKLSRDFRFYRFQGFFLHRKLWIVSIYRSHRFLLSPSSTLFSTITSSLVFFSLVYTYHLYCICKNVPCNLMDFSDSLCCL